jgi:hypothetical protein
VRFFFEVRRNHGVSVLQRTRGGIYRKKTLKRIAFLVVKVEWKRSQCHRKTSLFSVRFVARADVQSCFAIFSFLSGLKVNRPKKEKKTLWHNVWMYSPNTWDERHSKAAKAFSRGQSYHRLRGDTEDADFDNICSARGFVTHILTYISLLYFKSNKSPTSTSSSIQIILLYKSIYDSTDWNYEYLDNGMIISSIVFYIKYVLLYFKSAIVASNYLQSIY